MNKKGISPLIATVLIIGFTVALAAIVITWGVRFTETTQENVARETDVGLTCSRLSFDIESVDCPGTSPTSVDVTISSNTNQEIHSFIIRTTDSADNIGVDNDVYALDPLTGLPTTVQSLDGFDADEFRYDISPVPAALREIEVIARIQLPGQNPATCQAGIQRYVVPVSHINCYS